MQVKPLNDYLSINPIIPDRVQHGIYVHGVTQLTEGYVLAIGPGKLNEAGELVRISSEIKVGSKVMFSPGSLEIRPIRREDGTKDVACFLHADHVIGVE